MHIYHYDVWCRMAAKLAKLEGHYDLHLTVNRQVVDRYGQRIVERFPKAQLHVLPNVGMDILPFLHLVPMLVEEKYEQVLKLHTKNGNSEFGRRWGEALTDALIGDKDAIGSAKLVFARHPGLSMMGPAPFFLSAQKLMLKNLGTLNSLGIELLNQPPPRRDWGFFAGTMFWSRPREWLGLAQWAISHASNFEVGYSSDGQLVHALERIFGLLPSFHGKQLGLIHARHGERQPYYQVSSQSEEMINRATSKGLVEQFRDLERNASLFEAANLLDLQGYQKALQKKGWDEASLANIDLVVHYLLIGQFSGDLRHSKAWAMRRENNKIPWRKMQRARESGLVSIITPVFNQLELTRQCVNAVSEHTKECDYEMLLVDNGSDAETRAGLACLEKEHPHVRVLTLQANQFFALGSNLGFAETRGEFCVFLNNDTEVQDHWLMPLIVALQKRRVFAAQPQLLYPDGSLQCIGVVFSERSFLGYPIYRGLRPAECRAERPRLFNAITAACMAIRAEDFASMRGFDSVYINGQEDIDLCMRARLTTGKKAAYVPESKVIHHESKTLGRGKYICQNRLVFVDRWRDAIQVDDREHYELDGARVIGWRSKDEDKESMIRSCEPILEFEFNRGSELVRTETALSKANRLFRSGSYEAAEALYWQALVKSEPELVNVVKRNLALVQRRKGEVFSEVRFTQSWLELLRKEVTDDQRGVVRNASVDESALTAAMNIVVRGEYNHPTNDDPSYSVDLRCPLSQGYYALDVGISVGHKEKPIVSKLYVDYGRGFNEEDSFEVTSRSGCGQLRVIYFKGQVEALRFDPIDHKEEYQLQRFTVTPLKDELAQKIMILALAEKGKVVQGGALGRLDKVYVRYAAAQRVGRAKVSYEDWIERLERPGLPSPADVEAAMGSWSKMPLLSVVMPTYNTSEKYLRLCIESVIGQSYPCWELCIADDASPDPNVVKILEEYAARDRRIKVVARTKNGHISAATNSAIAIVEGDFIVLLDHDDALAEHALYFVAQEINKYPNGDIFYSDEDKIDADGRRSSPHFKSSWNPDLFFSQNYVSHLGVYRTEIVRKIGGFRLGVEGSQDQDLLLRCLPHVNHREIRHIPRVLYHWRMIEGSTAMDSGEKSYTTEAGLKALRDYFSDNGPPGVSVEAGMSVNTYKVNWPIPDPAPKVSLLIPARDKKDVTELAVRSILSKTTYPNYEIVILDNGSVEPETLEFFRQIQREDTRVSVLAYDQPFNYSAINNFGVARTNGELVGLVNNDVEVINPEWLTEMVSQAVREDIGCVGAKLYYSNGSLQHGGVILGVGGVAGHSHKHFPGYSNGYFCRLKLVQNYSAVTAACLIVRRDVYLEAGQLNDKDLTVAFNDVDFCLRVREAGYRNLWTPYAELYHHESLSRGHEDTPEKKVRFAREAEYMKSVWNELLTEDPFYSPNLTRDREDFSIG